MLQHIMLEISILCDMFQFSYRHLNEYKLISSMLHTVDISCSFDEMALSSTNDPKYV